MTFKPLALALLIIAAFLGNYFALPLFFGVIPTGLSSGLGRLMQTSRT